MSELRTRRHRLSRALAATALFALASPVSADEPPASSEGELPVTQADVVTRVVEENPTVRSAVLSLRSAERLVTSEEHRYGWTFRADTDANIGRIPSLAIGQVVVPTAQTFSLGAQFSRTFAAGTTLTARLDANRSVRKIQAIPTMPSITLLGPGYGANLSLTVAQPLLRGFGRTVGLASRDSARFDRDRAQHAAEKVASQTLSNALVAYWELWYAGRSLEIQRAALALAERQREDARARARAGALSGADALEFDSRVAELAEAVIAGEQTLAARRSDLVRLVGVVSGASTPSALVASESPDDALDDLPPGAVDAAVESSPELAEIQAQIDAARRNALVAGDSLRPRLDATATLTAHGMGYDDPARAAEQLGTLGALQATIGVVYEGALDQTRRREEKARAEIAVQQAEQTYADALVRLTAEVRAQTVAFEGAVRRAGVAADTVAVARRLSEAESQRFNAGAIALLPVLQADETLRQAELREARARVDARIALVRLQHLSGRLLERWSARLPE
ncbi:MAG: TolC family protein [Polyangiales bacterium]